MHVAYIQRALTMLLGMGGMVGVWLPGRVIPIEVVTVVVFGSNKSQCLCMRTSTACRSMNVVTCGIGQEKGDHHHYA